MFALGAMHGGGHEVPWNRAEAQTWFHAAAERSHPHAQLMYGRYLARGLAGRTDPVEARIWIGRALAQGLTEAQIDLNALPPVAATPVAATPAAATPPVIAALAQMFRPTGTGGH